MKPSGAAREVFEKEAAQTSPMLMPAFWNQPATLLDDAIRLGYCEIALALRHCEICLAGTAKLLTDADRRKERSSI